MQDIPLNLATLSDITAELRSRRIEFILLAMQQGNASDRDNTFGGFAARTFRPQELLAQAYYFVQAFPNEID